MQTIILKQDRLSAQMLGQAVCDVFRSARPVVTGLASEALRFMKLSSFALALVGVDLPDMDGLDVIPEIVDSRLARQIVVVSERSDGRTMSKLRRLPYAGLVDAASADPSELQIALQTIARGNRYTSPSIKKLLGQVASARETRLSPHEEIVLSLLGEGLDNDEAAARLDVSPNTIRNHRANIMSKLRIHDKGALIRYACGQLYVRYTGQAILHPGFDRVLAATRGRSRVPPTSPSHGGGCC